MFRELVFLVLLLHNVVAYNILAIVTIPYRSHTMAFAPFFRELAKRGHNVTVMNNFPDAETTPNLKFIDVGLHLESDLPRMEYYESIPSWYFTINDYFRNVFEPPTLVRVDCENLLKNEKVREDITRNKYDVIIAELFISECGLAYALQMSDAPVIGITSHVLLPSAYGKLGIPFDFASQPYYRSDAGVLPPLAQKVSTYLRHSFEMFVRSWLTNPVIKSVFEEHLPGKTIVDLDSETKERMNMVFAYQHYSVTGARLLAPQLIEIGGIHVGKPKPVSKEIETILSNANNGAIYVSFGTYLRPHTMSKNKLEQIFTAFKRLPYKIIWKIDNITIPEGINNIHTGNWWPQLDLLCHPKILGFVSHAGMLSISEAAHCGKPIITVPFFGDQFSNSAALQDAGLGKFIYLSDLNAANLEGAIMSLTSDEMQENARRISRIWHDRPQPVMDSAIYWTEYLARHKHAPPSLPSKYNTWFASSLLDVYSILILMLLAVFLVCYLIVKVIVLVLKKLLGSKKQRNE